MTQEFTASNGITLGVDNRNGKVWWKTESHPEQHYVGEVAKGLGHKSNVWNAIGEWMRAKEDERLGRWRHGDFLVYDRGDYVQVIHEPDGASGMLGTWTREQASDDRDMGGGFGDAARAYFDAHPEPKPEGVHMLSYDFCKTLPIGSSVVDFEGYWAGRCYVKTSDNTWAYFSSRPEVGTHWRAVDERRNNLSPGPSDYWAHVYDPPERPKPWHDAKEGEVWELDFKAGTHAWFVNGYYFQSTKTLTNIYKNDPDITSARKIWPTES